jgi:hypothetical protein
VDKTYVQNPTTTGIDFSAASNTVTRIGQSAGNAALVADILDFRIYTNVFSAAERQAIYAAYPRGSDGITRGLIGRWLGSPATQTGGTIPNGVIIPDLSGNGNHGYATNGVFSAPSIIGNRRIK